MTDPKRTNMLRRPTQRQKRSVHIGIDDSPEHSLDPENKSPYAAKGLAAIQNQLNLGGTLSLESIDPRHEDFTADLRSVIATAHKFEFPKPVHELNVNLFRLIANHWSLLYCGESGFGVADEDGWLRVRGRDHKVMLAKQFDVLVHSPFGLIEAIFHGITDACKAFEIGRVETEEFRVFGGFHDE